MNLFLLILLAVVLLLSATTEQRGDVSVLIDVSAPSYNLFLMPGDQLPNWKNLRAEFRSPVSTDSKKTLCRTGNLSLNDTVPLTGEQLELRITKTDPSTVTVTLPNLSAHSGAVNLQCAGKGAVPDLSDAVISFPLERDKLWGATIRGRYLFGSAVTQTALGNDDFRPSSLYIVSGSIVTEVKSLPFPSGSIKTTTQLYPGDVVALFSGGHPAISYGTLKAAPEGIRLVARSRADIASLTTAGSATPEEMVLAPPWWSRFQAQSEWAVILAIYLLINGLIVAYDTYCRAVWAERTI